MQYLIGGTILRHQGLELSEIRIVGAFKFRKVRSQVSNGQDTISPFVVASAEKHSSCDYLITERKTRGDEKLRLIITSKAPLGE